MARIDTLPHFLEDVADAIRDKKGSSDLINIADFDTEIENLPSGGGADLSQYFNSSVQGSTMSDVGYNWTASIKKMPDIVITTTGTRAFYGFKGTEISSVTASGISSFERMFNNCTNLTTVNLEGLNGTGVTNIQNMFRNCSSIETIDLSNLIFTYKYVNAAWAFGGCTSLTRLDVRNIDFSKVTTFSNMLDSVPTTCEIIVKDTDNKTWFNTNFSSYTNVKTVEEYEQE